MDFGSEVLSFDEVIGFIWVNVCVSLDVIDVLL